MKKVLITGENSYVGTSFKKWMEQNFSKEYQVDTVGMRNGKWQQISFEGYEVVIHVAGIAHVTTDKKLEKTYYDVNTYLSEMVAIKSKEENVKHFLFMSSIIVYGNQVENGQIQIDTIPQPNDFYGMSKLKAEKILEGMNDKDFKVAIIRSPMVYGEGCKGNFPKLVSLSKWTPIFPEFTNKRSMIYIDNLSIFLKNIIDMHAVGVFYPQNKEYINTSEMVKIISDIHKKPLLTIKSFNWLIRKNMNKRIVNKVFGNLFYDHKMSKIPNDSYQVTNLYDSIKASTTSNGD